MNTNVKKFDKDIGIINNGEEFMPIPGYPRYYASKSGKIYSDISKKILHQYYNGKAGYLYISAGKNCHTKTLLVHRAVGLAWLNLPEGCDDIDTVINNAFDYQINHMSEIKENCTIYNLEYTTASDNINYGSRNSIVSQKLEKNQNAVGHHYNTNAPRSGSFLYEYDGNNYTLGALADKLCCSKSAITEAYRKTTGNIVEVKRKRITRILKV